MMHLQYVDDEGDKVLLATDSDLVAAVNFARISGWKVSLVFYKLLCTSVGCVCAFVIKVFGIYPRMVLAVLHKEPCQ